MNLEFCNQTIYSTLRNIVEALDNDISFNYYLKRSVKTKILLVKRKKKLSIVHQRKQQTMTPTQDRTSTTMWSVMVEQYNDNIYQPLVNDTLISVGWLLKSGTTLGDHVSARNEDVVIVVVVLYDFGSTLEIGNVETGNTTSCFGFFGFCSCWLPDIKLPTTTYHFRK